MSEERVRILKMVEEGRISAEEGARLLEALESAPGGGERASNRNSILSGLGRMVRFRVIDAESGYEKVNLVFPLAVARLFGTMVPEPQRLQLEERGIRINELIRAIESGETGNVVTIEEHERGEQIVVSIE